MFKNNIKIAFRSLLKNKGYSFLNIFGLAIGITCASLIFLWVEDEMSFDAHIPNQEDVFYVPINHNFDGEWATFYSTPRLLASDLKNEIPEIKSAATAYSSNITFELDEDNINSQGMYADADIFDIFGINFIEGNALEAFKNPESIVLTKATAISVFGNVENIIGKPLKTSNGNTYTVTGVVENLPNNTSFKYNWLVPFEHFAKGKDWMLDYANNFADTFVKLNEGVSASSVNSKIRNIISEKDKGNTTQSYAFLHSAKDWYLRSEFEGGEVVGGRITYVRLFGIIALIILAIACINFMNLTTARSEKRANEVGVRKTMGSSRSRLVMQFISEAFLLSVIATIVSVALLVLALPQFNTLVKKDLVLGLENPVHLITLLCIALICGLLAGLYPAFYLSSFKPIDVLKGFKATHGSSIFIRKGLVVGQFVISMVFIVSTIVVYQQIQHVKHRDLGFDKEQLLAMLANPTIVKNFEVIKDDLLRTGAVKNLALSNSLVIASENNRAGVKWKSDTPTEDVLITMRHVSPEYLETTGMQLKEGRDFSANSLEDKSNVLITESFAKLMANTSSALGQKIYIDENSYNVIGVVEDYLFGDMYGSGAPVMFFNNKDKGAVLHIKLRDDVANDMAISKIETVMKAHNPAIPFDYSFVDDIFNGSFKSEELIGKLSQLFAILAILISCIGLFGLAAYTAEQRNKEIGIRKVLGASVSGIVKLLSKDFIKLVGIAILIAIPIAWYATSSWLQDYAYRIEINWWIFVMVGVLAILIALATVSFQAVKAAIANPVDSLKTE